MKTNFRSLDLAKALHNQCSTILVKGVTRDQLERASLSVYLNLAEGSGKLSLKEKNRFFNMALGSLRETQAILDLIDAKKELEIADKLGAHIWRLIKSQTPNLIPSNPKNRPEHR